MIGLCDCHCHPFMSPLAEDWVRVRDRAFESGVTRIIAAAYDLNSWTVLSKYLFEDAVYVAMGLHPWMAREELDLKQLSRKLDQVQAVAVGEIGLDFNIESFDRARQISQFAQQLDLARARDLPVIIHCRGAFEELLMILADYTPRLRGMIHGFSRGPELAKRFVDSGLYISFGGAITRPRAKRARRSAEVVPLNRILLETDAPSIGLDNINPEDTEPRHVCEVARSLALLRGVDIAAIAEATTRNAQELFRID